MLERDSALSMNIATGGRLPGGMEWYAQYHVRVLLLSCITTVAYPLWNRFLVFVRRSNPRQGDGPSRRELTYYQKHATSGLRKVDFPFSLGFALDIRQVYVTRQLRGIESGRPRRRRDPAADMS